MKSATSEWAFPIVIVPKGGTLKPGEKRQWRLCVDLRKLNSIIPHDTFEPPTCDACLEWLAQSPAVRWLMTSASSSSTQRRSFACSRVMMPPCSGCPPLCRQGHVHGRIVDCFDCFDFEKWRAGDVPCTNPSRRTTFPTQLSLLNAI